MVAADVQQREGFAALVMRMRAEGISDTRLLKAFELTPRKTFVPVHFQDSAWSTATIPLECGSFLEGVDLSVRLLHLLDLKDGQRVLDIGTGSGYLAAVISRLVERVLTVDRYRSLTEGAHRCFNQLDMKNVVSRQVDAKDGLPGEGTFDRIIATAAFSTTPRAFVDQLVAGGMMLAPIVREDGEVIMTRLTKIGSRFEREDLFQVPYLPLVPTIASAL